MHRDRITVVEALAATHYHRFTESHASATGMDAATLYRHARQGERWTRFAPSLYGRVDAPEDCHRPIMAAALSLGDTGVPSHASAARLLGYDGVSHRQDRPEVLITDGNAGWGWRVHRRCGLPSGIVVTDQIPHTNARRTARDLDGEVIVLLDLAWPEFGLFVVLGGGMHEQLAALRRDRRRQNDVVRVLGWGLLPFTWDDVVRKPTTTGRVTLAAVASSHRLAV